MNRLFNWLGINDLLDEIENPQTCISAYKTVMASADFF